MQNLLGIYSSKKYNIQFPSTHDSYPRGDSPYETIIVFEKIDDKQVIGSILIKSSKSLKWDKLLFIGQKNSDDEITLVTNQNHQFSGRYKLFLAFGQISIVYISFNLDLKFNFTVKKENKQFRLPSSNLVNDTFTKVNTYSHCYYCNDSETDKLTFNK